MHETNARDGCTRRMYAINLQSSGNDTRDSPYSLLATIYAQVAKFSLLLSSFSGQHSVIISHLPHECYKPRHISFFFISSPQQEPPDTPCLKVLPLVSTDFCAILYMMKSTSYGSLITKYFLQSLVTLFLFRSKYSPNHIN